MALYQDCTRDWLIDSFQQGRRACILTRSQGIVLRLPGRLASEITFQLGKKMDSLSRVKVGQMQANHFEQQDPFRD